MRRALVSAFVLATLSIAGHAAVTAQTTIDVRSNTATRDFPNGIRFELTATSPSGGVDEARLEYRVAPDGVRASAVSSCTAGSAFTCTYQLVSSPANLLIPGAEVTYSWTVTAGGTTQGTPEQTVVYEDSRFEWKTLTEGNMTLWYYSGSEDDARSVLEAAFASEQQSSALLQTTVDYPVKLFYYRTAQEMQPAIQSDNEEGVITLGEVVYSDTAMVAADSSPEEIARHEVAHLVQRAAIKGPYDAPDWVIEGMAVYMQSQPLGGQRDAIESAIDRNNVLSVRSMSSASSGALSGNVFLFYGEAWSLVKFLIDTYGEQKFADFFRAIDAGAGDTGSLEQVYGFNQDGLENAWRTSVGLPPRAAPTPEDRADATTPDANAILPSNAGNDDTNVALVVGIIAVTAVLASSLLGLGLYLARRLS